MTDNEIIKTNESNSVIPKEKIKAIYPHIVVSGKKPYYSIHWYDVKQQKMICGFSSYKLNLVRKWLQEEFEVLYDDIENLIDRQQAEIQRITEKFNCQQTVYADLSKIIKNQKEEIVRLEYENEILSKNADTAFQDGLNEAQDIYAEQIKDENKSEAIKEFAEKVKANKNKLFNYIFSSRGFDEQIDNLVKEMVGDTK